MKLKEGMTLAFTKGSDLHHVVMGFGDLKGREMVFLSPKGSQALEPDASLLTIARETVEKRIDDGVYFIV